MTSLRRRISAAVATVVVAALVLTGCVPQGGLPDGPYTPATSKALGEILSAGGVSVIDEPTDDLAVFDDHVVVITRDQLVSMAAQIVTGSGYTGATLDGLAEPIDGFPPFSFLLAGWAKDHDGPGAAAVRRLLGELDYEHPSAIMWPDAALALFLADITSDLSAEELALPTALGTGEVQLVSYSTPTLDVGALCTVAADFIQNALAKVFNAIDAVAKKAQDKVTELGKSVFGDTIGSILGSVFGKVVGYGIQLFNKVVQGVVEAIKSLTAPFIEPLKYALAAIAILQQVSSALRPWSVTLQSDPTSIELTQKAQFGDVKGTVATQGLPDFPKWAHECASAVGIDLPKPPGPGTIVDWQFEALPSGWLVPYKWDSEVSDDLKVGLQWLANPEPEVKNPVKVPFIAEVRLIPHRDQLDALIPLVEQLIAGALSKVPSVLRDLVKSIVDSLTLTVFTQLKSLLSPLIATTISIEFITHQPDEDDNKKPDKIEDLIPSVNYENERFCKAFQTYELWVMANFGVFFGAMFEAVMMAGPGQIPVPESMASAQKNLLDLAPSSIRPVATHSLAAADGSISYAEAADVSAHSGALEAWIRASCSPDVIATLDQVKATFGG
ncbi:hypothetical protein BH10ACT7_BH10ACT7_17230 [soil metagenome]